MKEWVRIERKKGQFILSGSVRFTSRADIRESLTGRIVTLELLPFTAAEAAERPLPEICAKLLRAGSAADLRFLKSRHPGPRVFAHYLEHGGLPGICFFRDAHVRTGKFEAHLDTLLNRDIRQIYSTTLLYRSLRQLLEYLARNQGRPFEWADAARASQISRVSLKKVLFALEALFLIRIVPAIDDKKPTIFLEDQGMASWLKQTVFESADDITRGLYANLRQEYHYRPELGARIQQWRTRNDVEVPLIFSSRQSRRGLRRLRDRLQDPGDVLDPLLAVVRTVVGVLGWPAKRVKPADMNEGDPIFAGTPAGVGAVLAGDRIDPHLEGLQPPSIGVDPA